MTTNTPLWTKRVEHIFEMSDGSIAAFWGAIDAAISRVKHHPAWGKVYVQHEGRSVSVEPGDDRVAVASALWAHIQGR